MPTSSFLQRSALFAITALGSISFLGQSASATCPDISRPFYLEADDGSYATAQGGNLIPGAQAGAAAFTYANGKLTYYDALHPSDIYQIVQQGSDDLVYSSVTNVAANPGSYQNLLFSSTSSCNAALASATDPSKLQAALCNSVYSIIDGANIPSGCSTVTFSIIAYPNSCSIPVVTINFLIFRPLTNKS